MYKTGGLEPSKDKPKTMEVDGINYVVSDKLKTMLRDSFIDWGTFLEIYNDNQDYNVMFEQVMRLLNVKENENLREFMLPMVKKIYSLPADAHMASMLKQFMIYEPVSIAIHSLFTTIKSHFENLMEQFITARNKYILENDLKDKTNDLAKLANHWNNMNAEYNLDSSSIMLLFLHPPKGLKSYLNFNITGKESVIEDLKNAVKKFHYAGFCPKVPYERLNKLLEFPANEFVAAIKAIDADALFPDYSALESIIENKLSEMPEKPQITDELDRETPPANIKDKLELCKWYVTATLELRKSLVQQGKKFEDYYIKQANIFNEINDSVKTELSHLEK